MSFGLSVQNQNSDIVIDQDYMNHLILASGSYTQAALGISEISFTACARPPLVFVNSTARLALYGYKTTGGQFDKVQIIGDAANTVNYYIAAPGIGASSDSFGLRVFDASGNVVFDSGKDYLKVFDVVGFTTPTDATEITVNHASLTTPYYCLNALQGVLMRGGFNGSQFYTDYFYHCTRNISSTQAGIKVVQFGRAFGEAFGADQYPTTQNLVVGSLSA